MAEKAAIDTTPVSGSERESELTCSVCLEQFKDPKVLPCCHTFCKQCLLPLVNRVSSATKKTYTGSSWGLTKVELDTLSCPKCRAEHEIPEGDVDGFQTDFSLAHDLDVAAVVKAKERKPSCGQCESSDPSVAYCVECESFLCEFCSSAHKRMKSYREHNVFSLDMITSDVIQPSPKPVSCDKHPQEKVRFYCKTCRKLVCQDCAVLDHRRHTICSVAEARSDFEEEIGKLVLLMTEKLKVYKSDLKQAEAVEKMLASHPKSLKKKLSDTFDAYIAALESRRAVLLAEIDEECQADSKKVWAHKEFTETAIADVTASLRFAERACKCCSDSEMIGLTKQAIQRMKVLKTKEHRLSQLYDVAFRVPCFQSNRKESELSKYESIDRFGDIELQINLPSKSAKVGEILIPTVTLGSSHANTLCHDFEVMPRIDVEYGHVTLTKSFKKFTVKEAGKEGWTVTMQLVCGGKHTVSAALFDYSTDPVTVTVSGKLRVGDRVRPGPDRSTQDEMEGTVTRYDRIVKYYSVEVKWDDGSTTTEQWGRSKREHTEKYTVELISNKKL